MVLRSIAHVWLRVSTVVPLVSRPEMSSVTTAVLSCVLVTLTCRSTVTSWLSSSAFAAFPLCNAVG